MRKRENVTIGQSAKNTFVVPASNALPRTFTIFELTPAGYALNFSDGMDGRDRVGDQVLALPGAAPGQGAEEGRAVARPALGSLARQGGDRRRDGAVPVRRAAAGAAAAAAAAVGALVGARRTSTGCWSRSWRASFILHFGFVIYLRNIDWPRKPDIEEIPDRFVQMIVPPKKVEEQKPVAVKTDDRRGGEEGKEALGRRRREGQGAEGARPRGRGAGGGRASRPAGGRRAEDGCPQAARRARRKRHHRRPRQRRRRLGRRGQGLSRRSAASGSPARERAAGCAAPRARAAPGSLRGGGSLRASGPGEVGTGERGGEHAVHVIVKDSAPTDVDGSLDTAAVAREIRSRLGAVKACYEAGLKRNPNIGGKLSLRFEVSTIGKVTSAEIDQDSMHDDEVASCIKSRVMTWRFPAPSGGSVQFSYPFIFQAAK